MNAPPPAGDAVFRRLSDETLLAYARAAVSAVTLRSLVWLVPFVRNLLHGILTDDDLADAQESALVKLIESVPHYNPALGGGATFQTYAKKVVRNHVINLSKRVDWLKEHNKGEEELERALVARAEELDRAEVGLSDGGLTDPADIAAAHEACQRFEQVIRPLHPMAWPLWQEISSGTRLRKAAQKLSMEYESAWRLRERIVEKAHEVIGADRP